MNIKFRGISLQGKWHYGYISILKRDTCFVKLGAYISNNGDLSKMKRIGNIHENPELLEVKK